MWDGFNKRKFPRISVRCDIQIDASAASDPITAQTENLGIGGACVVLDRAFDKFETCKVRLFLGSKKEPIECEGRVVWIVPTREVKAKKTQYDTGIEFVGLKEDESKKISQYLQQKP